MKRNLKTLTSTAVVSVMAFSTLAADSFINPTDRPDLMRGHRSDTRRGDRLNGAAKASDLIGMSVKNYQHEKVGKVEDLAVDVESGRIVQVILSTGGFVGMGTTWIAVPPGALHLDVAHKVLRLDADKARLAGGPKYDTANWKQNTQSNRVMEVYGYYGEKPYFVANSDWSEATSSEGSKSASEDLKLVRTLPRNMDGTINTDGRTALVKARNIEATHNVAIYYNTITTRNPDGTLAREYYPSGNTTNSSWSALGYVEKASKLMGTPVKNQQDEQLGKVENILLDLSSGRIVAVIVSSGGFIGMGNELSAIPPTALRFNAVHDTLQLDASKEQLTSSPHFKANEWPDLSQPSYTGGIYRAYNVEPYFTADVPVDVDNTRRNVRDRDSRTQATSEADNTARNVRDRNEGTLTPLDQGNSTADVTTSAQIRKEIIAGNNMSVNARNVKIITSNGQVTLRGPVNTAEEKSLIGEIADRIAHTGNVNNQLEVKSNNN